ALKYCGGRPAEVRIDASSQDGALVFSVKDNGVGIDPADHARIFEAFQRLGGAAQPAGSGIGLSICREIVERHHGRIWVESTFGKGATFRFAVRQVLPTVQPIRKRPPGSESTS